MGRNSLMITTLLTVIYGYAVFGRLRTKPFNNAPGNDIFNFSMNCSSTLGSSNITWYFVPAGQSNNSTIASGSVVYPAFTQLYWIDQPTRNDSNLIIRNPSGSTTGTFTCADSEMVAHAQLILRYSFLISIKASDSLIVGDVISVSCSLSYLGNPFFTPFFDLYNYKVSYSEILQNNTSPQVNKTNSQFTATATFNVTLPCLTSLQMYCGTIYQEPVGNLLPGSATNAPFPNIGSYLVQRNVLCVPTDNKLRITGAISGSILYVGSILKCNVTSIPPANYSWTDLTYGNSSIGPDLTVWHDGSYRCTASNYVNGSWYSGSKTVYNLTLEKVSFTAKPLYGPIAGGTKVTVTLENWSKQVTNISAVYLGDILKTTVFESNRLSNSFAMTTANATSALIGQPLPITIEFVPGPYNISTNLSFTYQGNPEITGISPTTFVATGGTLVTATGTQLSSVAFPLIQATVVVERGIERNITSEASFESCEVIPGNGSKMVCPMPRINIPDDFLQVLDSLHNNRSKRDTFLMNQIPAENLLLLSRRKRYSSALSLIGTNGVDRITIYVGFILDGYREYENINEVLPDTQILYHSPPEINSTKDILEFDPNKDKLISVKGKYMSRGCRMADYLVQVGGDVCENNDLQDNQLSCRPPKIKPLSTLNDTIYCGDQHLSVTITLGNLQYQYACLAYTDQSLTRKVAIIIGLTVGLAGFVFFLAILIVCIVRCCRQKSSKQTNKKYSSRQEIRNPHYDTAVQLESRQDAFYHRQIYSNVIGPDES